MAGRGRGLNVSNNNLPTSSSFMVLTLAFALPAQGPSPGLSFPLTSFSISLLALLLAKVEPLLSASGSPGTTQTSPLTSQSDGIVTMQAGLCFDRT